MAALSRDVVQPALSQRAANEAQALKDLVVDSQLPVPPEAELHLNVEGLDVIDRACLDLLHDWQRENEPYGGRLALNHESLAARFWRRPRRRNAEENGAQKPRRERQVPI